MDFKILNWWKPELEALNIPLNKMGVHRFQEDPWGSFLRASLILCCQPSAVSGITAEAVITSVIVSISCRVTAVPFLTFPL